MCELIKNFADTDFGKLVVDGVSLGGSGAKSAKVPELELIRKMEVGDCVVVVDGSTNKKTGKNWKPYAYGRKYAIENNWVLRSVTVGNRQYLVRLESDGKTRHP